MKAVRVALVQMNTVLADVEANLDKHLEFIAEARSQEADLVLFPELSLTGYRLRDLVPAVARRPSRSDPILGKLLKASQDLDLVVGFVEEDDRQRFFVSSAYLAGGEVVHVHRKVYLPTYGLFEEGRFYAWGDRVRAFNTRFGRIGLLICEDFWHASPPYLLWLDGAEVLLLTSASPSRGLSQSAVLASSEWVERLNRAYASLFTTFVAHSNRIGYEDGLRFGGRATVYDPDGERIAAGPYHEEGLTYATLDLNKLRRTRTRLPLLRDERTELTRRELDRLLRNDRDPNPGGQGSEAQDPRGR